MPSPRVLLLLLAVLAVGVPGLTPERVAAEPVVAVKAAAVQAPVVPVPPGYTARVETTQTYRGTPRAFVLHVPTGLVGPAPLVVAMHGLHQTTKDMRRYTELQRWADRERFVVAFASGVKGSWNAGACCGSARAEKVDDVAYLDEVVRITRARTIVDPGRIFVTGFSNGAMVALRYACERSSTIAAAAVVAGPLVAPCPLSAPVHVLVVHGKKDDVVPGLGGYHRVFKVRLPGVRASLEPFRRAKGDVRLKVVPGGGHGWLDSTDDVWAWLESHPRPTLPRPLPG